MRIGNLYPGTASQSFWSDTGASEPVEVLRTFGRVMLGSVAKHNCAVDAANVTGGSTFQSLVTSTGTFTGWRWAENGGRLVSTALNGGAVVGIGETRNSSLVKIGLIGMVMNNGSTGTDVFGAYIDAVKGHGSAGNTHGLEIDAANLPGPSPQGGATPYKTNVDGMVRCLALAAGSDAAIFGRSYAIDEYLDIGGNGAVGHAGIVFKHNALLREGRPDDKTWTSTQGYGRAISLASEFGISMYAQNPAGGVTGAQREALRIFAKFDGAGSGPSYNLVAEDEGLGYFERSSGRGVRLVAGNGGSTPQIASYDPAVADLDLMLVAKGNGLVRFSNGFGNAGVNILSGGTTRYLAIKDGLNVLGYVPVVLSLP